MSAEVFHSQTQTEASISTFTVLIGGGRKAPVVRRLSYLRPLSMRWCANTRSPALAPSIAPVTVMRHLQTRVECSMIRGVLQAVKMRVSRAKVAGESEALQVPHAVSHWCVISFGCGGGGGRVGLRLSLKT